MSIEALVATLSENDVPHRVLDETAVISDFFTDHPGVHGTILCDFDETDVSVYCLLSNAMEIPGQWFETALLLANEWNQRAKHATLVLRQNEDLTFDVLSEGLVRLTENLEEDEFFGTLYAIGATAVTTVSSMMSELRDLSDL